jgi:hypothetical protein
MSESANGECANNFFRFGTGMEEVMPVAGGEEEKANQRLIPGQWKRSKDIWAAAAAAASRGERRRLGQFCTEVGGLARGGGPAGGA